MTSHLPNLRQIRCFQAIVELGNFSRAAERLNSSQASVSHAIRDLETLLGVRLFNRTTRSVELTEAGRLFASGALPGLMEIQHAVEAMDDLIQLRRGVVRVAAPPLLAAVVLPKVLEELAALHPDLRLRIEDVAADLIVSRVRSGLCDIGIGTFDADEEGIKRHRAVSDHLTLFAPPGHAFAAEVEVPWTRLADQPVIALTRESRIRQLIETGFAMAAIDLHPVLEVHQIQTALALVESGAGIALLPTYAHAALRDPEVVVRPLTKPQITREVSLVTQRDRNLSPAAAKVHTLLGRILRELAPDVPACLSR